MRKVVLTALVLGLVPNLAGALEIKNVRPTYGPNGALRSALKVLPGDFVFLSYDIEGLTVDPKTGKVSYVYKLELLDPGNKTLYSKDFPMEMILQMGGNRVPGEALMHTGAKQPPGQYTLKVTITDKQAKESKTITYPYELVKEEFGFVGIMAPSFGVPGGDTLIRVHLVNMGLEKKQPNVEITLRILDEAGNPVSRPIYNSLPKDLPDGLDLTKENFVPLNYPLTPNRPGRFTIEISAKDKVSTKEIQLRYPMVVLDLATIAPK